MIIEGVVKVALENLIWLDKLVWRDKKNGEIVEWFVFLWSEVKLLDEELLYSDGIFCIFVSETVLRVKLYNFSNLFELLKVKHMSRCKNEVLMNYWTCACFLKIFVCFWVVSLWYNFSDTIVGIDRCVLD